ncbi:MAG: hypothetical protein JF887_02235 [Candidatus Dormibacteraeota bacterium]|uniref:Polysaccharide biosynthesis protein n=1 Tax=Candidatus Amunia macphersoniae TaxID=3127014 RepID=A0A934KGF0_9BACT|nr:hypothetical protein [Candidatus Dormibacteraeota bacterium]
MTARALGPERYAPLATFWSLLFVAGPGFFVPLEQEVGRALAARRARGDGGRPLVLRAAAVGGALAVCLIIATVPAAGPLARRLFAGDSLLVVALMAGLAVYALHFLSRGTLSGNGRFRLYGFLIGIEGVLRLVFCVALAVAGVKAPGMFGLSLVLGSLLAIALVLRGRRGLLIPGPPARWSELSSALGYLLAASVCVQLLLSVGPVAVQLLATATQRAAAGQFLTARVIAFMPIFLFQAVQAPLLPKLSGLLAAGRRDDFRRMVLRLLAGVVLLGACAVTATALAGPWASRLLFGSGYSVTSFDFGILSASCVTFMVAQVLTSVLIAFRCYARMATGWLIGAVVFVGVTAAGTQLFVRVELGLLGGSVGSALVMACLLGGVTRRHTTPTDAPTSEATSRPRTA